MGCVFLLALLLPLTLGTGVSAPRSVIDVLSGFSTFNLSLSKLLLGPVVGLGLTIVVYSDPNVPKIVTPFVLIIVISLDAAALIFGARRREKGASQSQADFDKDGIDHAHRFKRLEDVMTTSSQPRRH